MVIFYLRNQRLQVVGSLLFSNIPIDEIYQIILDKLLSDKNVNY